MNTLSQVLEANKCFVFQSKIDSYTSISKVSKVPSRSIAILTCMDTRLVDFLEPALGIKRGEAKVIKNAGWTAPRQVDNIKKQIYFRQP